jgi:lysophospholipase L1-like esterase
MKLKCFITFSFLILFANSVLPPNLSRNKKNLTWVVFGDSLTEYNFRAKLHYFDYVAEELSLNIINLGVSSTGYKEDGGGEAFYKRIEKNVKDIDFDIFTIFGSFNDLGKGYALGQPTDSTPDTICGCVNLTIDNFRKVKPLKKIALVTPTIWRDNVYYGDFVVTRKDLDDYVEALLQIAKLKRIPILDLYHYSGLDPNIDEVLANFYIEGGIQDNGVHPNSLGHKFMYPMWREFVKQFIDNY